MPAHNSETDFQRLEQENQIEIDRKNREEYEKLLDLQMKEDQKKADEKKRKKEAQIAELKLAKQQA